MVYGLWFIVYSLWVMGYGLWFMVYGLWSMVYSLWVMVYCFFSVAALSFESCRPIMSISDLNVWSVRSSIKPKSLEIMSWQRISYKEPTEIE